MLKNNILKSGPAERHTLQHEKIRVKHCIWHTVLIYPFN